MAEERGLDEPVVNIVGEVVALGPPRRDRFPTYRRWFNDLGTLRWLGAPVQPMALDASRAGEGRAIVRPREPENGSSTSEGRYPR